MDREMEKVEQKSSNSFEQVNSLAAENAEYDDAFLDYEDEDELDRFESKQSKKKIQQKRRKAAGA